VSMLSVLVRLLIPFISTSFMVFYCSDCLICLAFECLVQGRELSRALLSWDRLSYWSLYISDLNCCIVLAGVRGNSLVGYWSGLNSYWRSVPRPPPGPDSSNGSPNRGPKRASKASKQSVSPNVNYPGYLKSPREPIISTSRGKFTQCYPGEGGGPKQCGDLHHGYIKVQPRSGHPEIKRLIAPFLKVLPFKSAQLLLPWSVVTRPLCDAVGCKFEEGLEF
jgi:hypothetical protein